MLLFGFLKTGLLVQSEQTVFVFADEPVRTALLTTGAVTAPAQSPNDRLSRARLAPPKKIPEINREWCELRQRDIAAGKAPFGEMDLEKIAMGNALCRRWFGNPREGLKPTLFEDGRCTIEVVGL